MADDMGSAESLESNLSAVKLKYRNDPEDKKDLTISSSPHIRQVSNLLKGGHIDEQDDNLPLEIFHNHTPSKEECKEIVRYFAHYYQVLSEQVQKDERTVRFQPSAYVCEKGQDYDCSLNLNKYDSESNSSEKLAIRLGSDKSIKHELLVDYWHIAYSSAGAKISAEHILVTLDKSGFFDLESFISVGGKKDLRTHAVRPTKIKIDGTTMDAVAKTLTVFDKFLDHPNSFKPFEYSDSNLSMPEDI